MTTSLFKSLISDAFTIYLTFSGILLSLITLLYSFINGKRSELELCAEAVKSGLKDPLMKKRQNNLILQIKRISKINRLFFILLLLSIIACAISWVTIRFIQNKYYVLSLYIIGVFTLLIGALSIKLMLNLYSQYKNDIKI